MRTAMALRRDDAWARRVVRMVGVSTAVHLALFASVLLVGTWLAARRPAPIIAYSVELTDFPGTGGQLPAGPGKDVIGRSPAPAAAPKASAAAAAPANAAKPRPPPPRPPKAEVKAPPAPVAKPVAKVEPKVSRRRRWWRRSRGQEVPPKPVPQPRLRPRRRNRRPR
jgi:hypothetical protein